MVEEDLASVFGRCKIAPTLESSFKTVVVQSSSNISLLEGIVLQGGPGPTVARALRESPYFVMVVQLSLLSWVFPSEHLAMAIADVLRKRSDGAPTFSALPSTPDRQGIFGVLQACESQTSAFNWNMMLEAVSTTLGYGIKHTRTSLPRFALQGLVDMLPMVQTLPSDRFIHIQIAINREFDAGIPVLVVWAHHVLDLTVVVRTHSDQGKPVGDVRFGNSDLEQVFIEEADVGDDSFITLLDAQKEHLLTIKPQPDAENDLIKSISRVPAKGWGTALLMDEMSDHTFLRPSYAAIIEELQMVTIAFAFTIAKSLVKDDTSRDTHGDTARLRLSMVYNVDEDRLLQASKYLFDLPDINRAQLDSYVALYRFKRRNALLPKPPALDAVARASTLQDQSTDDIDRKWNSITVHASRLAVFLIALAHVVNLEDCDDLMFPGLAFVEILGHELARQVEEWDGKDALRVSEDAWLQAIAVPFLGFRGNVWKQPWAKICLISDRGWSAWISTFGDADPTYVSPGSITFGRGSPCRNGVWKAGIWDSGGSLNFRIDPLKAESCGQMTSLRCAEAVSTDTPYCGEGDSVFVVSARFRLHRASHKPKSVHRVGYKKLQRYLWWARTSKRCSHGRGTDRPVRLAVGCATIAGFGNHLVGTTERILIFFTAHDRGARWLALATIPNLSILDDSAKGPAERQILLRGEDCCYQCVIDQAATLQGKWSIIL